MRLRRSPCIDRLPKDGARERSFKFHLVDDIHRRSGSRHADAVDTGRFDTRTLRYSASSSRLEDADLSPNPSWSWKAVCSSVLAIASGVVSLVDAGVSKVVLSGEAPEEAGARGDADAGRHGTGPQVCDAGVRRPRGSMKSEP